MFIRVGSLTPSIYIYTYTYIHTRSASQYSRHTHTYIYWRVLSIFLLLSLSLIYNFSFTSTHTHMYTFLSFLLSFSFSQYYNDTHIYTYVHTYILSDTVDLLIDLSLHRAITNTLAKAFLVLLYIQNSAVVCNLFYLSFLVMTFFLIANTQKTYISLYAVPVKPIYMKMKHLVRCIYLAGNEGENDLSAREKLFL